MAEEESRAPTMTRSAQFNGRALLRLGLWSLAAGIAVMGAVLVATSEVGLRRVALTFGGVHSLATNQARESNTREAGSRDSGEMQRLSDTLRQINTDRIRMITRLEAIERHLDDITGSIARNNTAAPAAAAESGLQPPSEAAAAPSNVALGAIPTAPAPLTAAVASQQPSPAAAPAQDSPPTEVPASTKADFGVDLGTAQTVDGLRVLWTSIKGRHAALLDGMRPIIAIREPSRPGHLELRLVVGPVPSAALAARLCVAMNAAGAVCQPAVFDGQRLALR